MTTSQIVACFTIVFLFGCMVFGVKISRSTADTLFFLTIFSLGICGVFIGGVLGLG